MSAVWSGWTNRGIVPRPAQVRYPFSRNNDRMPGSFEEASWGQALVPAGPIPALIVRQSNPAFAPKIKIVPASGITSRPTDATDEACFCRRRLGQQVLYILRCVVRA